jgi:hypothetical protein
VERMKDKLLAILIIAVIISIAYKVNITDAFHTIGASLFAIFILYLLISLVVYIIKGIVRLFGYNKK